VRGGARAVQDDVDAFDDGGWWEGRITQILKARFKVKPLVSANVLSVVKEDVRTGVVWDGREWKLRQPREWKVAQPAGELTLLLPSAGCKRTVDLSVEFKLACADWDEVLCSIVCWSCWLADSWYQACEMCARLLHACGLQHLLGTLCPSALLVAKVGFSVQCVAVQLAEQAFLILWSEHAPAQ